MRPTRKSGSVGTLGGQPPRVTRHVTIVFHRRSTTAIFHGDKQRPFPSFDLRSLTPNDNLAWRSDGCRPSRLYYPAAALHCYTIALFGFDAPMSLTARK